MSLSTLTSSDQANPSTSAAVTTPIAPPTLPTLWQRVRSAIPTVFVIALLAGLGFFGHANEWTLPKFSALLGNGTSTVDDWCAEHSVPESTCIECKQDLFPPPKGYEWCKEHGVAPCPLHHPELAQLKSVPTVTAEDFDRAGRALALRPRFENNSRCMLHERRIQFASVEAMDKAGVDIAIVVQRPVVEAIVANGEVVYDETASAHLSSRVTGTIARVVRRLGDRVAQGDVLALIDAAEVGKAKSDFLQAISSLRLKQATLERLRPLAREKLVEGGRFQEAEAAYQEARIRLQSAQQVLINLGLPVRAEDFAKSEADEIARRIQLLGLPEEIVASLNGQTASSNLWPLRAPLDGVVVASHLYPGEVVDTTTTLFDVADVRRMWLSLAVRQDEAKYLSLGQPVLFRPSDGENEPEIQGSLAWISTEADDRTRTVRVRVDLPNSDGRLRANTFGTGRIVLRDEPQATVVPSEAVRRDGDCDIVFVRDKDFLKQGSPKFFHVRKVRVGVKDADTTEIIAGLLPGEVIASKNSVVLEGQLLKSNLGAGCCEVHAK